MNALPDQAVPDRVLKWVVDSAGPQAIVRATRQLHGGTSSLVHNISLEVNQVVTDFVLRQFYKEEWLQAEPDLALHEAESVRWAARTGLPVPEIVAFDETGSECGIPAVLMTRLEGTVVMTPPHMDDWLNQLAKAAVRIHGVNADRFPWTYFTYNDIAALQTPSWSSLPQQWNQVIEIVRGPRPQMNTCFIHRDYHPANVLWSGDTVSGVVDWVNACQGPAGIDLGHCRLNLALLHGVASADAFLSAYQNHAGSSFTYDPYWDLLSLIEGLFEPPSVSPAWTALGVTGLTDDMMVERMDAYTVSLLQRACAG
jgi:aminoglycoside phosphotransferase (APT) family kinase protein